MDAIREAEILRRSASLQISELAPVPAVAAYGPRCVSSARRDLCGGAGSNPRPYRDRTQKRA
jgi:hypothetical protein